MSTFDLIFFSVFNHFKARYRQKANRIAITYLSLLQIVLILLLSVFFSEFAQQMHITTMSSWKAWTLFFIISIVLYFRNWIVYSGKKRKVLNAKRTKSKAVPIRMWKLWLLLVGCFGLAIIILKI